MKVLLMGWVGLVIGLGGLLTLLHEGPLPLPEARPGEPTSSWTMTHGFPVRVGSSTICSRVELRLRRSSGCSWSIRNQTWRQRS